MFSIQGEQIYERENSIIYKYYSQMQNYDCTWEFMPVFLDLKCKKKTQKEWVAHCPYQVWKTILAAL